MIKHRALWSLAAPWCAILLAGLLAFALLLAPLPLAPAQAQEGAGKQSGEASSSGTAGGSPGAYVAPLSVQDKTAYIRKLIDGELDAGITTDALFVWSLRYRDVARANVVEELVEDDAFYARASQDPAQLETLRPQEARLALAQAAFLRLPAARRKALLSEQRARNAKAASESSRASDEERALGALQAQIASLETFLKGDPDPNGGGTRFWIAGAEPEQLGEVIRKTAAAGGESAKQLREAIRQRDELLGKVLALPDSELQALEDRRRLMQQSGQEIAAAEDSLRDATTAREQAQFAARTASTASARLTAAERARLLAVQQKQAEYRSALAKASDEPSQILDAALKWRARVGEVSRADLSDDQREQRADALYREIVAQLKTVRKALSDELSQRTSSGFADAMPGPLDPAITDSLPGARQLQALRDQLVEQAGVLASTRAEQMWKRRKAHKDAMVTLNDARLALIGELSPGLRRQVLGFGGEGTAQVLREFKQIALVVRYNIQSYDRQLREVARSLLSPSPAFIVALVELALAILLFRLWRQGGGAFLARTEALARARRPQTLWSGLEARALHHLRHIKQPLDWFVFIGVLRWVLPDELNLPGVGLAWMLLTWLFGAAALLRLIDSIAGGGRKSDPRAALRWRSLRLVGGTFVVIALILRLTAVSVGRGGIYSWVLSGCWLVVPPVLIVLSHWWRERIVALTREGAGKSTLLNWVARDPGGFFGTVGRLLAGAVLLGRGLVAVIMRQVRNISLIRDIYGQRSRRQAAHQAAEDLASGLYRPLDEAIMEILAPHRLPSSADGVLSWPGDLHLRVPEPGTVTALLGNRGHGKSALLDALEQRLPEGTRAIRIGADEAGLARILGALGEALGLERGERHEAGAVLAAMAEADVPLFIAIDDLQRLVVPAIGGLEDFDATIDFIRRAPPQVSWVLALGRPAWDFLLRARHDRLIFDAVLRLPRWTAAGLRALVEARNREAGIEPDFSEIHEDSAFLFDAEVPADERRKRGYYARLREYSGGNPAVALEFWRRSLLVENATGRHVVRSFATPDVAKLSEMPDATLFVLRTIILMDKSDARAIARSTDLSPVVIADVLRGLVSMGIVIPFESGYRVTLRWWREVIDLLVRRNLVMPESDA